MIGPDRAEKQGVELLVHAERRRAPSVSGSIPIAPPPAPMEPARESAASAWDRGRLSRLDWVLALAIAATALLARWPLIDRGETLLHSDEAIVGIMAQDIAAGRRFPIYFYGQRYMGALEAYVIAALTPLVERPITALRLAPALFFAAMTAAQYLMLRRWFGRFGGLAGAATLIAASPAFAQWSVSARGGYVEILLWGTLLLWSYGEWFVARQKPPTARRRFLFGFLIGSGMWINPSISLFIAPIIAHAFYRGPLAKLRTSRTLDAALQRLGLFALPVAVLGLVLIANIIRTTSGQHDQVHSELLLGLLPKPAAAVVLIVAAIALVCWLHRRTRVLADARAALHANSAMVFGALVGVLPSVYYLASRLLTGQEVEPAVPLALRPFWRTGETLQFLAGGLPIMLGADTRLYLDLLGIGRESPLRPLDGSTQMLVSMAQWWVAGGLLTLLLVLIVRCRAELADVLRLRSGTWPPEWLLAFGVGGLLALYVLSRATHDFNTYRYLVPLWAFIPGLVAAAVSSFKDRNTGLFAARLATGVLLVSWLIGQVALVRQIGAPHPLRPVADALLRSGAPAASGELFDSHLLSYLTAQRCRIVEFEPFWERLGHFRAEAEGAPPVRYVVNHDRTDWLAAWRRLGLPGDPPPEVQCLLRPAMDRFLRDHPDALISRRPLAGHYELVELDRPIPQRGQGR